LRSFVVSQAARMYRLCQVNNEPVDLALKARYPHWYWSISDKKTYCKTRLFAFSTRQWCLLNLR
jgi:hypothetical protein